MSDRAKRPLDVLRERGWYQGDYEEEANGPVCMLGAANVAFRGNAWAADVPMSWIDAVEYVIAEQFPDRKAPLVHMFNDHPATTFADVELVLEKAEIRLSEGHR